LRKVLESNAKATSAQRFSGAHLLFVSDSLVPPKTFGHRILQTTIYNGYIGPPIKMSTAIIIEQAEPFRNTIRNNIAVDEMSTTLLIFVDLTLEAVSIGCFTCDEKLLIFNAKIWSLPAYPIKFENAPSFSMRSFQRLIQFWTHLHSKIPFGPEDKGRKCFSLLSYKIPPLFSDETSEAYELFFLYSNCSNFENCMKFYSSQKLLPLGSEWVYINVLIVSQVFPFGQN